MDLLAFNFHNYSDGEIDAIYFIGAFVICLMASACCWKAKLDSDTSPKIINSILVIFVCAYIIYESIDCTKTILCAKLVFTLFSCWLLQKILDKIFN